MMKWILFSCLCYLTLGSSAVSGRSEYRIGGPDGNPWQAVLETASEYLVFDAQGQQRTVPVGISPFGAGADTMIHYDGTSIQPREFEENVNLVLTDPSTAEADIPLPLIGGRVQAATSCVHAGEVALFKPMFDGDPGSATFNKIRTDVPHGGGFRGTAVIDLGAALPINRIRFYPRLGQRDDLRVIESFTEPHHPVEVFSQDSFIENTLSGYELRTADNSVNIFITGPCDRTPRVHGVHPNWIKAGDERLTILSNNQENLQAVVDLRFQTRSVRWLTLQPLPRASWEVAEFEVYGEGFVKETAFISQILDFGRPVNWGRIRWSGDFPEGTRVEVRTRTGNTLDPNFYFEKDANGNIIEITKEAYEDINYLLQLPTVYDTDNWTFWSPVYDFEAGLRDPNLPAADWRDGLPIISTGIARYLQLDIRLFGTFQKAPRLDQIAIQFSETPVAQEVVAEIWPIEVTSYEPTTFTYVVKPTFEADNTGFDHLEILTYVQVDQIRSIKVDGQEIDSELFKKAKILPDRLEIQFPRLAGEGDSFKQIEVVFDVPVFRFGTQFTGWIFDSEDLDQIKQRIQPGNSTFRFSGDDLSVRSPIGGNLLIQVEASPSVFSPNGDGINDLLTLEYNLREVTTAIELSLEIYDLSGRLVIALPTEPSISGSFKHTWNGRDAVGNLVPPGTYLYRLLLDAEENEEKVGVFAMVY